MHSIYIAILQKFREMEDPHGLKHSGNASHRLGPELTLREGAEVKGAKNRMMV